MISPQYKSVARTAQDSPFAATHRVVKVGDPSVTFGLFASKKHADVFAAAMTAAATTPSAPQPAIPNAPILTNDAQASARADDAARLKELNDRIRKVYESDPERYEALKPDAD